MGVAAKVVKPLISRQAASKGINSMARIFLLPKLISTLVLVCKVIDKARSTVEPFVPDDTKTEWNNKLDTIKSACDFIRAVDYQDGTAGTTAPWGSK